MNDRRKFLKDSSMGLTAAYLFGMQMTSCSKKISFDAFNSIPETSIFQMKHIRGRVGYFTEKGGTIGWMLDGKKSVLVDTQFPEQVVNLLDQVKKVADGNFEAIFNTHHHGDHTSGNIALKDHSKKFIAHSNSLKNQKSVAMQRNNLDKVHLPNITFDNTHSLKVGAESIKSYYFGPAHTDGDIVIHFEESNVVHLGDLLFNRRYPYIDKGAGASIKGWIGVHDHILNQFDNETKFIAGHAGQGYGVLTNKEDIKAFQNYLTKLLAYGEKCIKEGKTIKQAIEESKFIPGAEEWKGDGISRSLEAVYVELGQ